MIQGIPNIRNSCYAASILQCMIRCLRKYPMDSNLLESRKKDILSKISGEMDDAHKFYMDTLLSLPSYISNKFMFEYQGGEKMPYLPITPKLENGGNKIIKSPEIVSILRIPSEKNIRDFAKIEIDIPSPFNTNRFYNNSISDANMATYLSGHNTTLTQQSFTTRTYKMVACICYIPNSNSNMVALSASGYSTNPQGIDHCYALILDSDKWIRCDDNSITYEDKLVHPIYMVFYESL